MAKSQSTNRAEKEPYIHEPDPDTGTIEETEGIYALPRGDDWLALLIGDFESTNTPEAQDQLSLEQGLTDPMSLHDFDTGVFKPVVSRMEHHCEHPGCSESFATSHGLL
jgi:hypothetical protein